MKSVRQSLSAFCVLLFTLGVAAFVFSAISPDDDDVQQEFVQQKSSHSARIQDCSTTPTVPLSRSSRLAYLRSMTTPALLNRYVQASVLILVNPARNVFASVDVNRSPPGH
jgi:hypothetical protein